MANQNLEIRGSNTPGEANYVISLKYLLEITPQIQPYFSQLGEVIKAIDSGKKVPDYVQRLIHARVAALALSRTLDSQWEIKRFGDDLIVAHRDYLAIQDEFPLTPDEASMDLTWSAQNFWHVCQDYPRLYRAGRRWRRQIYHDIVHTPYMEDLSSLVLVALPSHLDANNLWTDEIGIPPEVSEQIPAWAKFHESGIVYASRKYRDDQPRGHDFFAWAARMVVEGKTESIEKRFKDTVFHEGVHGNFDRLLIQILGVSDATPVYEGLATALGGSPLKPTNISLEEFLAQPMVDDITDRLQIIRQGELNYGAGPRLFLALYYLMRDHLPMPQEAWKQVIISAATAAHFVQDRYNFATIPEAERIAIFYGELIQMIKSNWYRYNNLQFPLSQTYNRLLGINDPVGVIYLNSPDEIKNVETDEDF